MIDILKDRGLWPGRESSFVIDPVARKAEHKERQRRIDAAIHIWSSSVPITGTLAEEYLRNRRIIMPLPDTLRFHGWLSHPSGNHCPGMVALVQSPDGKPVAVHRTFLSPDGGKAKVEPTKAMLGPVGGGAVRLAVWKPGETLLLSEGIETGLTGLQLTGKPCWACLSTSGLKGIILPPAIRDITILVDADEPGEQAAADCARRLLLEGRTVKLASPPAGCNDYNDALMNADTAQS
ncbi:MAG: toprim domain-containing protein [Alphaproteobacteria bacterium]|nr:toprim domain-containing protein [Alphaproteobacteria bacterium]